MQTSKESVQLEPEPQPAHPSLWKDIRESFRGSKRDYTEGSIGRAILVLAVPMVMEMAMESVFAVVDVFWVSQLGADAVATVGITESMMTIIYAVAMGLSVATTAMVARRIGEKDPVRAASTAVQSVALGLCVSIPFGIAGVLLASSFLRIMGASESVIETGWGYTAMMTGGNATILLLFLINAIFRGAGDAAIAMRVLWFANFINIVLDPCLIFGWGPFPELGVTGAAVATNIGRGLGVVYQLTVLMKGAGRVVIGRKQLRLEPPVMIRLLQLSGNGILQALIGTASWIGLIRILTTFGSAAVAGYTLGIRIIIFALLPSWGMGNAAATMVGQSLGAGKPDRAERSVWIAGFLNMVFLGMVGLFFVMFAEPVILLFTSEAAVIPMAVECLRYISYGFLFYAYGMVVVQAFNGAGDTFTPMIINLFCFWLWEIPIAYVLAVGLGLGPRGVFIAITVAFSTLAVVSIVVFRRGGWKDREV